MKFLSLILLFPLAGMAQYTTDQKLSSRVNILTDSGNVHGYYVFGGDSSVMISTTKRYSAGSTVNVPVNSIREMHIKERPRYSLALGAGVFVLGFTVTAGLTKNAGDVDYDGKTSFWELLYTAIEGSTSKNRRRRNTALIVGGAGGTLAVLAYLLSNNKLSLVFPINDRRKYYDGRRGEINKYAKF